MLTTLENQQICFHNDQICCLTDHKEHACNFKVEKSVTIQIALNLHQTAHKTLNIMAMIAIMYLWLPMFRQNRYKNPHPVLEDALIRWWFG